MTYFKAIWYTIEGMCGIIGGRDSDIKFFVESGLTELARRGPDSQQLISVDLEVTFGATRLAMTDPNPRSNQPMIDPDTGNAIVFNGEVYNFKELRSELRSLGIKFFTESDTEVILKLISYLGYEAIAKLEGMFAFSFLDKKARKIILARDFLGKKPLYYYSKSNTFLFSSYASLIQKHVSNANLKVDSVVEYLVLGYVQDPNSMFDNVHAIGPGELLVYDLEKNHIESQSLILPRQIFEENLSTVRNTFENSLLDRVNGHKTFALSLSGGIDSTIIALECARLSLPVEAYSLGFPDLGDSEFNLDAIAASKIAKKLNIKFTQIEMPKSTLIPNLIENYVTAMDEPNATTTGISQLHFFSEIAEAGHRLVLTGDGGDELFSGYSRYELARKIQRIPFVKSFKYDLIYNFIEKYANFLSEKLFLIAPPQSNIFWLHWHSIMPTYKANSLLNSNTEITLNSIVVSELKRKLTFKSSRIEELMLKDLAIWLSMESNRRLDRTSMWSSVEARSPFQSEKLVALSFKILRENDYKVTKKSILYREFPELNQLALLRKKRGFSSPQNYWLMSNPDFVQDSLLVLQDKIPINKSTIGQILQGAANQDYGSIKILWSLVILANWIKKI
jgi:asparagine synthase (glutamine-hydrolysing)